MSFNNEPTKETEVKTDDKITVKTENIIRWVITILVMSLPSDLKKQN